VSSGWRRLRISGRLASSVPEAVRAAMSACATLV
jgi:hypothetical protein